MMSQAELECTELLGHPAARGRLESETGWVDNGDDRKRSAAVGEIDAANASLILDQDAEEILVRELLGMASCLNSSHHELIFWRERLHDTLLLLLCFNFVFDFIKFEAHVS